MGRHNVNGPDEPWPEDDPTTAGPRKIPTTGRPLLGQPLLGQPDEDWPPPPAALPPISAVPPRTGSPPIIAGPTIAAPMVPAATPRLSVPAPDLSETAIIPAVPVRRPRPKPPPPPADETTLLPKVPADATTLLPAVTEKPAHPDVPPEEERPETERKGGEEVVLLRATKTEDGGYKSVFSELTRPTFGSVLRTTVRTTGELLITFGLILLLFAAYEVWGKAAIVNAHQEELDQQLSQEWDRPDQVGGAPTTPGATPPAEDPTAAPPPKSAIARMYIPRLDKHWVVVEGVNLDDIKYAPGHYPKSAKPGQKGNFAVAGHRSPAIFWDLDKMVAGDVIVVETRQTFYTYRVTQQRIVRPTAVEVVEPLAGREDDQMLTITTCHPRWDNYERLIVHAEMVASQPRSKGKPAVLVGG